MRDPMSAIEQVYETIGRLSSLLSQAGIPEGRLTVGLTPSLYRAAHTSGDVLRSSAIGGDIGGDERCFGLPLVRIVSSAVSDGSDDLSAFVFVGVPVGAAFELPQDRTDIVGIRCPAPLVETPHRGGRIFRRQGNLFGNSTGRVAAYWWEEI